MTEAPRELFDFVDDDGVIVAVVRESKIISDEDILEFSSQLNQLAARPEPVRLVVDFGKVKFLSSAALGRLVHLKKRLRDAQGELRLCAIDPALLEVFRITRLDTLFEIHETRAAASDSLRRGRAAGDG
jgi:anti-sigma B factor antagonist